MTQENKNILLLHGSRLEERAVLQAHIEHAPVFLQCVIFSAMVLQQSVTLVEEIHSYERCYTNIEQHSIEQLHFPLQNVKFLQ